MNGAAKLLKTVNLIQIENVMKRMCKKTNVVLDENLKFIDSQKPAYRPGYLL